MKKIYLFSENDFALLQVKSTSNEGKWTQFKIIRLFSLNENFYACHILMTSLIFTNALRLRNFSIYPVFS